LALCPTKFVALFPCLCLLVGLGGARAPLISLHHLTPRFYGSLIRVGKGLPFVFCHIFTTPPPHGNRFQPPETFWKPFPLEPYFETRNPLESSFKAPPKVLPLLATVPLWTPKKTTPPGASEPLYPDLFPFFNPHAVCSKSLFSHCGEHTTRESLFPSMHSPLQFFPCKEPLRLPFLLWDTPFPAFKTSPVHTWPSHPSPSHKSERLVSPHISDHFSLCLPLSSSGWTTNSFSLLKF